MSTAKYKPSSFTFRIISEADPGARMKKLFEGPWAP